jgi:hypothetical protein
LFGMISYVKTLELRIRAPFLVSKQQLLYAKELHALPTTRGIDKNEREWMDDLQKLKVVPIS